MNKKIIIGVSLFLSLVIGITYAWFTWNSEDNTNVSVTIEGINITYEDGEDITGINLIPVSTKEKGETDGTAIAKEIKVSSNMNAYLDLNMNLEVLPEGLKDASFKWEFYKGDSLLSSGNFADNNQGDNIGLLSNELVTSAESTYKLYIWIDGTMSNPNTMQNQTFKFMLNANATDNVESSVEYGIATETITKLLNNNLDTMNNDDLDGNVRYMGSTPNNYVTFNNELWRIIGVFNAKSDENGAMEKRLKIIRDESLNEMAWDSNKLNNWTTSSLNTYLNEDYYNSIALTSQSLIEDTYWNLGGTQMYGNNENGLASHWYGYERGSTVYGSNPSYWIGKIGLMYPSDYGYATSGGITTSREECLAKELYGWNDSNYSECYNNNYLYELGFIQWTIIQYSGNSSNIFDLRTDGSVNGSSAETLHVLKPVLYLNSSVKIISGDGSSTSPFTLSMN